MLQSGTTLAQRYVLREAIARGGMGEVWRADDTVLDRVVAVKTLLPSMSSDPGFVLRFRTEARAMAALSDPSIVDIYDVGQVDGTDFIVMRYVEGESLRHVIDRVGTLPPDEVMQLVAQAATALQLAHEHGIVHRDVKPGNLLIRQDGRLVLTDFGVARMIAATSVTEDAVLGTATYLAPEQVTSGSVTSAVDQYALGIVAYECLVGTPPFEAESPLALALRHTDEPPPPLPDRIPMAVRRVVLRALAKDPDYRFPSAAAMASAALSATVGPRPVRTAVAAGESGAAVHGADEDKDPTRADLDVRGRPARNWSRRLVPLGIILALVGGGSAAFVAATAPPAQTATVQDPAHPTTAGVPGGTGTAAAGGPAAGDGTGSGNAVQVAATSGPDPAPSGSGPPTSGPPSSGPPTSVPPTSSTSHPNGPPSHPPRKVAMIDVVGWSVPDATAAIEGLGLVVEVVTSPVAGCTVLDQSVPAKAHVDAGSTVLLTVGTCATG
jgi:serine/threonine-protein kinase